MYSVYSDGLRRRPRPGSECRSQAALGVSFEVVGCAFRRMWTNASEGVSLDRRSYPVKRLRFSILYGQPDDGGRARPRN